MLYSSLKEKIMSVPEEYLSEIEDYVDYIIFKYSKIPDVTSSAASEKQIHPQNRKLGIADGKYSIPDNIDICNDEIARMFGVNE